MHSVFLLPTASGRYLLRRPAPGKFTDGGATSGDEKILGNLLADELGLKACQ